VVNALCLARTEGGTDSVSDPGRETGDPEIVLGLLTSIERDSAITQRKLAGDLGIALGLANSYLRRCVRKGLVKMSQVPLNRYAYYLTPQGFAEKSRLTAEYLAVSFDFFRRARGDCALLLRQCTARGWRRVALYGAGDLAEIVVLSVGETGIEVAVVIDPGQAGGRCAGLPVVADLAAARLLAGPGGLDGIILTDTGAPQARFEQLLASAPRHGFASGSIVAPSLLGISTMPAAGAVAEAAGAEAST
jgi:DNA-binding MarR family transcriptional regulator